MLIFLCVLLAILVLLTILTAASDRPTVGASGAILGRSVVWVVGLLLIVLIVTPVVERIVG